MPANADDSIPMENPVRSAYCGSMQLVIDLPAREEQLAFNRRRWEEICDDPFLARVEGRLESNALGEILMSPPPSGNHSQITFRIQMKLKDLIGGIALPECPVSTINGVRAADVGWYSEDRFAKVKGQIAFEIAPEICVEVLSRRNTAREMTEKKRLYFEAGAEEVWLCDPEGSMSFFLKTDPEHPAARSAACPDFPDAIG